MATTTALDGHIDIVPGKRGGKPCIAEHRIAVQDVMQWHLEQGQRLDEIATNYQLSIADVYAAMVYYFDHQDAIDKQIADSEAFVEQFFADPVNESLLDKKKTLQ